MWRANSYRWPDWATIEKSHPYVLKKAERIEANCQKTAAGCWEWSGCTNGRYPIVGYFGRQGYAHRFMAFAAGIISHPSSNSFVCHSCDNPICVNPAHLFAGSHEDNMKDMVAKNRQSRRPHDGELNPNTKLTISQVDEIRQFKGTWRDAKTKFPIKKSSFYNIRSGRTWKLAPDSG